MNRLMIAILRQLLFAVWLAAMWILLGTDACTHPIEHLAAAPIAVLIPAAVVTCRLCSDPRVMRWLDEQK